VFESGSNYEFVVSMLTLHDNLNIDAKEKIKKDYVIKWVKKWGLRFDMLNYIKQKAMTMLLEKNIVDWIKQYASGTSKKEILDFYNSLYSEHEDLNLRSRISETIKIIESV
jgi:hypothetical protein